MFVQYTPRTLPMVTKSQKLCTASYQTSRPSTNVTTAIGDGKVGEDVRYDQFSKELQFVYHSQHILFIR